MGRLFLIDGYNLLFSFTSSNRPLPLERNQIIRQLQKECTLSKIEGALIFDGRVRHGEESGRHYHDPLEVIYTPKNLSADAYILETIEIAPNPNQMIVVSNDRSLLSKASSLGAQTMKNGEFFQKLFRRKKKKKEKSIARETRQNIERLLRIFEEKLQKEEDL